MGFDFEMRPSDSPLVEMIWSTQSEGGGSFMSRAAANWEMVVTRREGQIDLTLRGPETKARPAPIPTDAEFLGIVFKMGTFMPHLPAPSLVNEEVNLPRGVGRTFWLHGSTWEFPSFDNTDTFIARLVREGLLVRDVVIEAALHGQPSDLTPRTLRRHLLRATGLTYSTIRQIERAQRAVALLERGASILDTAYDAGYFDQAHMTRALKHFAGQTPAQLVRAAQAG
ncbi:MAG TPA: AraC family transcriptional regulator [Aggregatilinea sp.]|uniref:helix-turn-helix domain-containing protein n=1 Tax=Aggregatilinea sp. TaxID=2806333 RepID=UPI002CA51767|nr:AraC family transcriptional regulator [Aggregatilinea sp.]HML21946.1 AraC family transcriptional regulator [Aggregatilinea sp.]